MKAGTYASSPLAVCRALPSGCLLRGSQCHPHVLQFATSPIAAARALQLSSAHSLQSELHFPGRREIGSVKHHEERGRWRVCAQLAESSNQLVQEQQPQPSSSSKCVLVVGATGGVGQLVVAALLDKGLPVRAVLRSEEKARALFGEHEPEKFQVHVGDTRQPQTLDPSLFEGVTHVICCTGTTAFPSKRWDGNNGPEQTDWQGVRNLVAALPKTIQQFVLVSSIGVTKSNELPWNIMNLFGVLKYKKMGEDFLRESGVPYTIIRPGRLTDGPYTSYDLNTLLKATAGTRRDVIIGQVSQQFMGEVKKLIFGVPKHKFPINIDSGTKAPNFIGTFGDTLVGEASRVVVAEACIQALDLPCTIGQTYEISSVEGEGPGKDTSRWGVLFKGAHKSSDPSE